MLKSRQKTRKEPAEDNEAICIIQIAVKTDDTVEFQGIGQFSPPAAVAAIKAMLAASSATPCDCPDCVESNCALAAIRSILAVVPETRH